MAAKLNAKLALLFGSNGGMGTEDEEAEEHVSYEGLVSALGAEEKARAAISSSLEDLQGELQDLLSRRFQSGKRSRFHHGDPPDAPESPSASDGGAQFVYRKCMCGCGESRLCRADGCDGSAEPVNIPWPTLSPLRRAGSSVVVDAASQRAHCDRLTQRRAPRAAAAAATAETRPPVSQRPVDLSRLELLARPRELPEPRPPSASGTAESAERAAERERAAAAARRAARRSSSEPSLLGASPLLSSQAAQAAAQELPSLVDGAAGVPGRLSGATGAALRPPPRRASKLRATGAAEDTPGLGALLQAAEERYSAQRQAAFPSGPGPGHGLGLGTFSPPAWTSGKVRSTASQQSYLEARLYQKPAAKANSLEGLEQRLQELRRERQQREGSQPQQQQQLGASSSACWARRAAAGPAAAAPAAPPAAGAQDIVGY